MNNFKNIFCSVVATFFIQFSHASFVGDEIYLSGFPNEPAGTATIDNLNVELGSKLSGGANFSCGVAVSGIFTCGFTVAQQGDRKFLDFYEKNGDYFLRFSVGTLNNSTSIHITDLNWSNPQEKLADIAISTEKLLSSFVDINSGDLLEEALVESISGAPLSTGLQISHTTNDLFLNIAAGTYGTEVELRLVTAIPLPATFWLYSLTFAIIGYIKRRDSIDRVRPQHSKRDF